MFIHQYFFLFPGCTRSIFDNINNLPRDGIYYNCRRENLLLMVARRWMKHTSWQHGHFFFFWPQHLACRILVPQPGIEPEPPAMEVWSPNCCTTKEFPTFQVADCFSFNECLVLVACFKSAVSNNCNISYPNMGMGEVTIGKVMINSVHYFIKCVH